MSYFILAGHYITPWSLKRNLQAFSLSFAEYNRRGIFTICMIAVMAGASLSYLGALYYTFTIGFVAQENAGLVERLTEETISLEFLRQQKAMTFSKDHEAALASMEKVSEVRYLDSENVVMK